MTFFFAELPSLTTEPKTKIFAELDRNVDIPCLATGTLNGKLQMNPDVHETCGLNVIQASAALERQKHQCEAMRRL